MLTDEQLDMFIKIYRDRFGRKISREEASESAIKLVRLIKIAYRPISVRDYRDLQKRREETGENN